MRSLEDAGWAHGVESSRLLPASPFHKGAAHLNGHCTGIAGNHVNPLAGRAMPVKLRAVKPLHTPVWRRCLELECGNAPQNCTQSNHSLTSALVHSQ